MNTEITFNELDALIKLDIAINMPVALFSRPGTGKSSYLKDLSKTLGTEVFTIAVNQVADRADLTGVRLVKGVGPNGEDQYKQAAFPHATLMDAINYAEQNQDKPVIVFLDEFNRAGQDITTATMSFTTERKVGTIPFPDNIRFVLAGNLNGNVVTFDDATATRFSIYHIRPDHLTFLDVNPNLNTFIKDMIVDNKGYLMGEAEANVSTNNQPNPYGPDPVDDEEDDMSTFDPFSEDSGITEERTIPRTLTKMSEWLNKAGIDKSGSAEEMQMLHELMQPAEYTKNASQAPTLLQVSVESKIGKTGTALELVNRIFDHYDDLNKQAVQSVPAAGGSMTNDFKVILDEIRPSEELLEAIDEIGTRSELVEIVDDMNGTTLSNMLLWLTTTDAYQTLDGDVSPVHIMEEVAQQEIDLDTRYIRLFNQIIANPDHVVKRSIEVLKENTPATNTKVMTLVSFAETMID